MECTPTIQFSSTFNVGMVVFADPHKVVAQRSAFLVLGNVLNDGVLKVRTIFFGHAGLKHSFSQVKKNWIYKKSLNRLPFPKREQYKRL